MLSRITVLDFDSLTAREASKIVSELKIKRKSIDKPDLFIAATAVIHKMTFDTLNTKHFKYIDSLKLLSVIELVNAELFNVKYKDDIKLYEADIPVIVEFIIAIDALLGITASYIDCEASK
jgi:hypothetical protein